VNSVKVLSADSEQMIGYRLLDLTPGSPGDIALANWPELLQTVSDHWGHISFYLEARSTAECFIGVIESIDGDQLLLNYVNPQGEFEKQIDTYDVTKITRVDFGGQYEAVVCQIARERLNPMSYKKMAKIRQL